MGDVERLAKQVAVALSTSDPGRFADLLDPHVTWGAPGDSSPPCRNRQQVLAWYQQDRAEGRRAHVRSVTAHGDKLLVSMMAGALEGADPGQGVPRWQVLTVVNGRIANIHGYDDEDAAMDAVGQAR